MPGISSIRLLGEGFAVYRETATAHVFVLISRDYPFSLYVVRPRLAAVSEDVVDVGLVAAPEEAVESGMESV